MYVCTHICIYVQREREKKTTYVYIHIDMLRKHTYVHVYMYVHCMYTSNYSTATAWRGPVLFKTLSKRRFFCGSTAELSRPGQLKALPLSPTWRSGVLTTGSTTVVITHLYGPKVELVRL